MVTHQTFSWTFPTQSSFALFFFFGWNVPEASFTGSRERGLPWWILQGALIVSTHKSSADVSRGARRNVLFSSGRQGRHSNTSPTAFPVSRVHVPSFFHSWITLTKRKTYRRHFTKRCRATNRHRRFNSFDTNGDYSHPSLYIHRILPITVLTHRYTFAVSYGRLLVTIFHWFVTLFEYVIARYLPILFRSVAYPLKYPVQ